MFPKDGLQDAAPLLFFGAVFLGCFISLLAGAGMVLFHTGLVLFFVVCWRLEESFSLAGWFHIFSKGYLGLLVLGFLLGGLRVAATTPKDTQDYESLQVRGAWSVPNTSFQFHIDEIHGRHRFLTVATVGIESFCLPSGECQEIGGILWARMRIPGFRDVVRGRTYLARGILKPAMARDSPLGFSWPVRGLPLLQIPAKSVWQEAIKSPAGSSFDAFRVQLSKKILDSNSSHTGDFLLALTLGEGGGIDKQVRNHLSRLGTAHILAISGLHVAAVGAVIGLLVSWIAGIVVFRVRPMTDMARIRRWFCSLSAIGVAIMAGLTPSACRAAGMFLVATLAAELGRRQPLNTSIAVTGLITLLWNPSEAVSLSFLLSYSAVIGIGVISPRISYLWKYVQDRVHLGAMHKILKALWMAFSVSLAATLGTLPITFLAFGVLAPLGPLINLLVVPMTSLVIMPLVLVFFLVCLVYPSGAGVFSVWLDPVFSIFLEAQSWISNHISDVPVWPGGWGTGLVFLVWGTILMVVLHPSINWRKGLCILGLFLLCAGFFLYLGSPKNPSKELTVTFFSSGKGDAILVQCPDRRRWMVDTGRQRDATGAYGTLAHLKRKGVTHLDGVVLTHADEDHIGGLLHILDSVSVSQVVTTCPTIADVRFAAILEELQRRGTSVTCNWAGGILDPLCADGIEILWPMRNATVSDNDHSMVLRIHHAEKTILLTGDLESKGERALLGRKIPVKSDVLKLGHHGSNGASSRVFLREVEAGLAIVSGYPTRPEKGVPQALLERIEISGASLLSTEPCGDINVMISAKGIHAFSEWGKKGIPRVACSYQQENDEGIRDNGVRR